MKKITILYLDDFKYLGGAEIVLLSLLSKLDKNEFRPILAAPNGDKLEKEALRAGISFIHLPFDVVKKSYLRVLPPFKIIHQIRNIVSKEKVDIVHANSLWTLNFAAAALYFSKIPIVCSVHAYPRIHSKLKGFLFNLIQGLVTSRTKEFYVVSDSLKEEMIECRFPPSKLTKIENGVDIDRFNPNIDGTKVRNDEGIPDNSMVVGIVGRIHPGKGQGIFVDALDERTLKISRHPFSYCRRRICHSSGKPGI